ncbi:MAG: penicillin acylase family protein [Flavipsychrobacter sp.]
MRYLRAILPLAITCILVYLLNTSMKSGPALGKLLDPVAGVWTNAEPITKDYNKILAFEQLEGASKVWFDDRMVPHIHADNEHDLYFLQGYIHAMFRLWQMDMQTRAAAGRVSEIIGARGLNYDRDKRRKGMVYGAERSLKKIEADSRSRNMLEAYTAGVNQFISELDRKSFPLEYKLMSFEPEPWTNLKTSLLLKYMADDLTGTVHDIPLTYLKGQLDEATFQLLFPERMNNSTPVIPNNTTHTTPSMQRPAQPERDVWATLNDSHFDKSTDIDGKGSNNWAVSGSRTKNGNAILCNDPHLGLNLPSLWFEVQLQTPNMNVYGASLPGAPGVVIGFNENISWGLTNNYRDVKDYYEIEVLSDETYMFDNKPMKYDKRVEVVKIKGAPDFYDTVNYTIHGPVMYEQKFKGPNGLAMPLALRWMAHDESNELLSLYLLNHSSNYDEFVEAIHYFECPAQNMLYADKKGNIALWGQGQFINKWEEQGKYVMKGNSSSTLWGSKIPMNENPHVLNPQQGYLSSANQIVTDSTYPYWYNGKFADYRAWRINQVLDTMHAATVEDMFALQGDVHSILAEKTLLVMLQQIDVDSNSSYVSMLQEWDYELDAESVAATVYQKWWELFYNDLWKAYEKVPEQLYPNTEVTMQLLIENKLPTDSLGVLLTNSFKRTIDFLEQRENKEWYKVKNTTVTHLSKLPAFSFSNLKIGGWGNTVNASKQNHGPSWRMVVEMGEKIKAYGVYPGGQSGNPGSKDYGTFVNKWAEGSYYELLFLPNNNEQQNEQIKYTWTTDAK